MRTSITQAPQFRSILGKTVLALALVSSVGGLSTVPAFADDHGRYRGERERPWQREHDRYYERSWRNEGYHEYRHAYRPYFYALPPVAFAPYPWGGLSFFFDFH